MGLRANEKFCRSGSWTNVVPIFNPKDDGMAAEELFSKKTVLKEKKAFKPLLQMYAPMTFFLWKYLDIALRASELNGRALNL